MSFISIGFSFVISFLLVCVWRFDPLTISGSEFYFIDSLLRSGSTGPTEISGIPQSRTFFSNPCSAAWSSIGPVNRVSPSSVGETAIPPNQSVH